MLAVARVWVEKVVTVADVGQDASVLVSSIGDCIPLGGGIQDALTEGPTCGESSLAGIQ